MFLFNYFLAQRASKGHWAIKSHSTNQPTKIYWTRSCQPMSASLISLGDFLPAPTAMQTAYWTQVCSYGSSFSSIVTNSSKNAFRLSLNSFKPLSGFWEHCSFLANFYQTLYPSRTNIIICKGLCKWFSHVLLITRQKQ